MDRQCPDTEMYLLFSMDSSILPVLDLDSAAGAM